MSIILSRGLQGLRAIDDETRLTISIREFSFDGDAGAGDEKGSVFCEGFWKDDDFDAAGKIREATKEHSVSFFRENWLCAFEESTDHRFKSAGEFLDGFAQLHFLLRQFVGVFIKGVARDIKTK